MYLAEKSDLLLVVKDVRAFAGVHIGYFLVRHILKFILHADLAEDALDVTFQVVEIAGLIAAERQHHLLIGKLRNRNLMRKVDIAGLEELCLRDAAVKVRRQRCQHTVDGLRTHDAVVLAKRV